MLLLAFYGLLNDNKTHMNQFVKVSEWLHFLLYKKTQNGLVCLCVSDSLVSAAAHPLPPKTHIILHLPPKYVWINATIKAELSICTRGRQTNTR